MVLRIRQLVRLLAGGLVLLALTGCASLYFRDAGSPPEPAPQYRLENWPYKEYWTGVVFNGAKIGFTHLSLAPAKDDPGRYEIRSEAVIVLHFLGLEKKINLKAFDRVNDDLTLDRFAYEYNIDGNRMELSGKLKERQLLVTITAGRRPTDQAYTLTEKLYPSSAIALYPVFHSLVLGKQHAYQIYDGETQTLATVKQAVEGYESSKLFDGYAYKVRTELHGLRTDTWIYPDGKPAFELGLNGILITALEDEQTAKRYLATASLNKQEALLDFSLIRPDFPIANARTAFYLKIAFTGFDRPGAVPSDRLQSCHDTGGETLCEIRSVTPGSFTGTESLSGHDQGIASRYLAATVTVPSNDPLIRATARQITGDGGATLDRISQIIAWIQANIKREPVDVFSALDVLEGKKAECQGHAYLYAAFARSLGIPTRVVNGIVYSEEYGGFLFHSWTESLVHGQWLPVDPTFGQVGADATHVKLLEGEAVSDLMPLLDWVGKIRVRVIATQGPDRK